MITSDEATKPERIPRRAPVISSGAVGLGFASLFVPSPQVTVVEALDRIAPLEDPDISKALARAFRKRGITIKPARSPRRSPSTTASPPSTCLTAQRWRSTPCSPPSVVRRAPSE